MDIFSVQDYSSRISRSRDEQVLGKMDSFKRVNATEGSEKNNPTLRS